MKLQLDSIRRIDVEGATPGESTYRVRFRTENPDGTEEFEFAISETTVGRGLDPDDRFAALLRGKMPRATDLIQGLLLIDSGGTISTD